MTNARKFSYLREMDRQGYNAGAIGPFNEFMIPWLLARHGVGKDQAVVDIGAGQGHGLIPLHSKGWRNLVAADVEDYKFESFRKEYGFRTVLCDISSQRLDLPDAAAGAVLCVHVIEHLADPSNLMAESHRILRQGGKLFLVTPNWRRLYRRFYGDPTHVHPYDKVSLARLLRIFGFSAEVHSWNTRFGLGRLRAYRLIPRLGMIGTNILAVGVKA